MKTFASSRKGPFEQQTYYKSEEIDSICFEALRSMGLYPTKPEPIRIDRFVEKRFNVSIDYNELTGGVLGYTVFGKDGVKRVVISNSFDQEKTTYAQRRCRSTIAHEAGHGLLHTHLFCMSEEKARPLFADYTEPEQPKVLCRNPGPEKSHYDGNWWEYQANMTIGALLLPRRLVTDALSKMLESSGSFGIKTLPPSKTEGAAQLLAEIFNVNPAVAKIRINEMWPEQKSTQMHL